MAINEGFCLLKMIKSRRKQIKDPQKLKKKLSMVVFSFFVGGSGSGSGRCGSERCGSGSV